MEIVFDVIQEQDGGFVADCLNEDIITQGDSWEELRNNVREAVNAFFVDSTPPAEIRQSLAIVSELAKLFWRSIHVFYSRFPESARGLYWLR